MNKLFYIAICLCLCGCWEYHDDDEEGESFFPNDSGYKAIVLKRKDLDSSIQLEEASIVTKAAKIYIIDQYIFINDKHRGFHIFDNTDPTNPIKKNFLKIPGATDIAIRNNTFYINQSTDLVIITFNTTDFTFSIDKRLEYVFPEINSPDGFVNDTAEDEIVVNWIKN